MALLDPSVLDMQARALLLNKFAALIEEHAEELAMLEALVSQLTKLLLLPLLQTRAKCNIIQRHAPGVHWRSLMCTNLGTAGHCWYALHANALPHGLCLAQACLHFEVDVQGLA